MFRKKIAIKNPCYVTLVFETEIKLFTVLNESGKIFYIREFEPEPLRSDSFNLNASEVYTIVSSAPVIGIKFSPITLHKEIPMPPRVWNFNRPVKYVWKNVNKSPACIIPKKCIIYLNDMMREYPIGVANFIIEHEKGHRFYPQEDYCDLYAINKILRKGGNLYMCWYALEKVLHRSPAKVQRLKDFVKNIAKINYGRK